MTLEQFAGKYQDKNTKIKELTKCFNELGIKQRKDFLNSLPEEARKKFIDKIRNQAVKDFWYHEREAIMNGECTRDWTPEQIEEIMKISDSTGSMSTNANKAPVFDEDGIILVDKKGNSAYYGHHMVDVSTHPEFAGEWRNIQALDYFEHYYGAHKEHDTKTPTVGYYDVESKETKEIDVGAKDFSFEKHVKYPPKRTCVFQSNENMAKI